ncbi:MAG TPA: glycoside hydrolase family 3 N-terminal domain-containing protein, partial [Paracoccaceae bacterium]|nr:glycoside hydrolase family 3 N-terminal domain-containing protein [Paracoccaceae bacterium]
YRLIAAELTALGIDVDCAPLLDLARPETHPVIADRTLGADPASVALRGLALAESLLAGGVLPVLKHLPGHGRATADSHRGLPTVTAEGDTLRATDFLPFAALRTLPLGMTAHVLYPAIDPERCATLSPLVIAAIREEIGFEGLLMTDDLSMHALSGPFGLRAQSALAAGCDILLHCNGDPAEMEAVAAEAPALAGRALARAERALAMRRTPDPFEPQAALARLAQLRREVADA